MTKTYGELFAGCGGASLGLKNAGYQAAYVVEWNKGALDILAANHEVNYVIHEDVCKVDYSQLPEVDLLWASPSCQNYSLANPKRGETDSDKHSATAITLAAQYAETVVIENVLSYFKGEVFEFNHRQLTSIGFSNFASVSLDAADCGNPAARKRTYAIFCRQPIIFDFPAKARMPWSTALLAHRAMWVESQPTERQWNVVRKLEQQGETQNMVAVQRCGYYGDTPKVFFSSNPFPCIKSHPHHDGKRPRPGYGKIGGYRSFMDFYFGGQFYSITPQLLGILNGFPADYCWGENRAQAAAAIGNAVVPRMAEVITKDL